MTVALGFDVSYQDDRLFTLSTDHTTIGVHFFSSGATKSFDWRTGKPITVTALRAANTDKLVDLLDKRAQMAWNAQKQTLLATPDNGTGCDSSIVTDGPMQGDPRHFGKSDLAHFYVTAAGIEFSYGFSFGHAMRACEPYVNSSLTWAEAREYLEPSGPLGDR
jgi:hypothetical protein